jgi:hypothetical protein
VGPGIEDLFRGRESALALLVSIGATRLRTAGLELPPPIPDADHKLFLLLARESGDDAHAQYNALLRKLVSFERALECVS